MKRIETIRQKMAYLESREMLSRQGVIVIDQKGIIEVFNAAAEGIFQYPSSEVIGQNVKMLMSEPYRQNHDSYLKHYFKTGQADGMGTGRHVHGLRKDGTTFPMELAVSDVRLGERRVLIGIIKDTSVYEIKQETPRKLKRYKPSKYM